jgi:hypothetical protein
VRNEAYFAWLDRTPKPDHFTHREWMDIRAHVGWPEPPPRWIGGSGPGDSQIESKAWLEWKRARNPRFRCSTSTDGRKAIPAAIRRAVIERDGFVCGICAGTVDPADVHLDHIHPVVLGGLTVTENLRVTHSRCNIRKGAKVAAHGVSDQDGDLVR